MIKKNITFELTVDEEKVSELYPNYRFSFNNVQQFISYIQNSLLNEIPEDCMEKLGYAIKDITETN